jgi:hypothetical protein
MSPSAKRGRDPDDADRLDDVITASKQSFKQHIRARMEELRTEGQQIKDRRLEVEKRITTTGILTPHDLSLMEVINAEVEKFDFKIRADCVLPFPRRLTPEAIWEQSGHTDTPALHAMLTRFVKTHLPMLFHGLNEVERKHLLALFRGLDEVLRQQRTPDRRHAIRWHLVFEGRYVKRLPWRAAYEYASERLAGTSAGGGPEAMAKSYKLHVRRCKNMPG